MHEQTCVPSYTLYVNTSATESQLKLQPAEQPAVQLRLFCDSLRSLVRLECHSGSWPDSWKLQSAPFLFRSAEETQLFYTAATQFFQQLFSRIEKLHDVTVNKTGAELCFTDVAVADAFSGRVDALLQQAPMTPAVLTDSLVRFQAFARDVPSIRAAASTTR